MSNVTQDETVQLQRIPSKTKWRLQDFNLADTCFTVSALALVFTLYQMGYKTTSLILLGIGVLGFIRYDMGRGYYLLGQLLLAVRLSLKKGRLWIGEGDKASKEPSSSHIGLGVLGVQMPDSMLGMMSHRPSKTDNFIVVGRGSDQAALDVSAQQQLLQDLAAIIKRLSAEVEFSIGISWVFRRRPMDVTRVEEYILNNYRGGVVAPTLTELPKGITSESGSKDIERHGGRNSIVDSRLHNHQNELLSMMTGLSGDVDKAAVIRVKRHPKWREGVKKGIITPSDIDRSPVARMARTFVSDLTQLGVADARALTLTETYRFLRHSWDVATLPDYHQGYADGTIPSDDNEIVTDGRGNIVSDMQAYPKLSIIEKRTYCIIDGTYHRVIRIVRCPEVALPNLFTGLQATRSRWVSIALCSETMSGLRESMSTTVAISLVRAWDTSRNRTYDTPAEIARRREMENQHNEMFRSGSVLQQYSILIDVAATSLEELDRDTDLIEADCRKLGRVKTKVIKGRNRQLKAVVSATTGVNQL